MKQTDTIKNDKTQQKYGFYGRLKADFPSQVIIDVTEMCNLECVHCPHSQFKRSKYYSGASLSFVLNAKAVDEVRNHGANCVKYIRYSGEGEPLLNKHFFEMLDYSTKYSGGIPIAVTTNGTLLNELRIDRILATGVNIIDISIDAYSPETYAQIRKKGDLNITRKNVLRLLAVAKEKGGRTKIVVSYIEQPRNVHETADFKSSWEDHGADYVVIRSLHSAAGAIGEIAHRIRSGNQGERRPCVYPWERIVINPRGHLAFCPADWTHGSTIADYRETEIKEIWQSKIYEALRQAHLTSDFSQHTFCANCPDWKVTRWPSKGRAYADMVEEFKNIE
jgi:radical SAM protein with 4Fe4S-binding SPASM domain